MFDTLKALFGWPWFPRKPKPPVPPPPPKPLPEVERDVAYGDDPLQKIDIFRPPGMVEGDTAITDVMVHGGGWQNDKGDKANAGVVDNKRPYSLAQGHIFISANYPLWPQVSPLDEQASIAQLLAWVQKLPGVDPKRVRLWGHSAGGNLVAQVGASIALQAQYGCLPPEKIICLDSVYDIPKGKAAAVKSRNPQAIAVYDPWGTDEAMQRAGSPTYTVSAPMPPCFLAYSTQEGPGRKQQADGFAAAIVKNGGQRPVVAGYDYSHGEMDSMVGLPGPLTDAIDKFLGA